MVHVNRFLFTWYREDLDDTEITDYGDVAAIMWWEEDGGDLMTIELKFVWKGQTVTFTFRLRDDDDEMGSLILNFNDPLDTVYNTGDIKWEHN